MVERISNYLLDHFLYKGENVEGNEREIMLFGVTRIVEDVPKYLFVFIVSLFFNLLPKVGIVMLITVLYKSVVGGAHARTNIECFIYTSLYFFLPVIIGMFLNIPIIYLYIISVIIFIYSLYVIYVHVPADTEEIPILNKSKRKNYKIKALILITLIYILTLLLSKYNVEYTKIILSTIFFINLFTSKFMYKILRCKHSYESDEFKEYFNVNKEWYILLFFKYFRYILIVI